MNSPQTLAQQTPIGNVRRVLQALRANRTPGWQLPAHYLGLAFESLSLDGAVVAAKVGPHCTDGRDEVAMAMLAVMADVTMAAALRGRAGASARLATVTMRLSFRPTPATALVRATAQRLMSDEALALPMATAALAIRAGDVVCCTGESTFAVMDNRRNTVAHPLPPESTLESLEPIALSDLSDSEAAVIARARQADADQVSGYGFLEQFWGLVPHRGDGWAESKLERGIHVGNRVGDIHGGVLLALAANTGAAALPRGWRVLNISTQFLHAASGAGVHARADVERVGRTMASVDCEVTDDEGRTTLRAQLTLVPQPLE